MEGVLLFLNLRVLRVQIRVNFEDFAYHLPSVESSKVILEGHSEVSLLLFVTPGDDGLPLHSEAYGWLNYFILEQIVLVALLLDQRHVVLAFSFVLNRKIASAKVLPPALWVKLVKFCSKFILRGPVELDNFLHLSCLLSSRQISFRKLVI